MGASVVASLAASTGGESTSTTSYCSASVRSRSRMRRDDRRSEGFGGIGPLGMSASFGTARPRHDRLERRLVRQVGRQSGRAGHPQQRVKNRATEIGVHQQHRAVDLGQEDPEVRRDGGLARAHVGAGDQHASGLRSRHRVVDPQHSIGLGGQRLRVIENHQSREHVICHTAPLPPASCRGGRAGIPETTGRRALAPRLGTRLRHLPWVSRTRPARPRWLEYSPTGPERNGARRWSRSALALALPRSTHASRTEGEAEPSGTQPTLEDLGRRHFAGFERSAGR